jgi:type III secretory pathway component EscV
VAAVVLLIGLNLALSAGILLLAYRIKSALDIDLFPGHMHGLGQ